MFRKTNKASPVNNKSVFGKKHPPSIISSDMHILGNMMSEGAVDIDGHVEGNVKCSQATIRPNGRVQGDVMADSVQIYGEVRGLVKAKHVYLFASCRVEGTIMHETLSIEDGAFVDGKFKRTDKIFIEEMHAPRIEVEDDDSDGEVNMLENLRLIG